MTAREIGGYLELERFSGRVFHEGAVALNCGRGALAYLVELRGIRTMWVPDWMCASVTDLLAREQVEVRLYRVGRDMLPFYDFEVAPGEWMLLMDYYGQLCPGDVEVALARSGGRLAVDETQGFFRAPWPGAYTLYTCRKWFGVSDGGYLATWDGARLDREVPRDESHARMGFVLGRTERPAGGVLRRGGEEQRAVRVRARQEDVPDHREHPPRGRLSQRCREPQRELAHSGGRARGIQRIES